MVLAFDSRWKRLEPLGPEENTFRGRIMRWTTWCAARRAMPSGGGQGYGRMNEEAWGAVQFSSGPQPLQHEQGGLQGGGGGEI